MAVAYRHMGLGSVPQVMDFLNHRMGELQEMLSRWECEQEMWTRLGERPGLLPRARGYLLGRVVELRGAMRNAEHELGTLRELYDSFKPCPACRGTGKKTVQFDQDDVKLFPCDVCNGSCVSPA